MFLFTCVVRMLATFYARVQSLFGSRLQLSRVDNAHYFTLLLLDLLYCCTVVHPVLHFCSCTSHPMSYIGYLSSSKSELNLAPINLARWQTVDSNVTPVDSRTCVSLSNCTAIRDRIPRCHRLLSWIIDLWIILRNYSQSSHSNSSPHLVCLNC
jgi:hypothetical protein